jgi:hypothetical protein
MPRTVRYALIVLAIALALVLLLTLKWTCTGSIRSTSCGFTIGSPFQQP